MYFLNLKITITKILDSAGSYLQLWIPAGDKSVSRVSLVTEITNSEVFFVSSATKICWLYNAAEIQKLIN